MRALIWTLQAEADLYEIADSYSQVAPGLDQELLERIYDAPLLLRDYPFLGEEVGIFALRKWLVRRTPFLLLYRVTDEAVEVARVVPAASDWRDE